MFKNKKAFTLTEMIIVIVIIGILMMGTTIYLQGSDDTRKIIEAQGCATTIGGEINNYIFYALTSKSLRKSESEIISPNFYYITVENNTGITLGYSTNKKAEFDKSNIKPFKLLSVSDTCHQNTKINFDLTGGTNMGFITMNKGFSSVEVNNLNVFYISKIGYQNNPYLTGDIIMTLCMDSDCINKKETSKLMIDGRTQTVALKHCVFYKEEDRNKCREREN